MLAARFAFGQFVLDPARGTLVRGGEPVPVGFRALRLLTALLERSGEVLTKSDLIDATWEGAAVEEGNLSVQIASLRKLLGTSPDGADWIATIPRVGYRFAGAVERREGRAAITAGEHPSSDPEAGPSIAVLPFANLTNDPDQQYFADGLTEDIITRLSRFRWLFVTARNSSFTYRGRAVDVKEIGRELGVRYVLEGSVRRSGQQVRIGAQLADAANGAQAWAERYDVELVDFFALQDQITESVVAAIEPQLYAAEHLRLRSRQPESLDAWGFVMRAMPHVWTWGSEKDIETAQGLLKQAKDIDPDYARANSLLAWTHAARVQLGWGDPRQELAAALAMAQSAIEREPEDPWGRLAAGYVHMVARRSRPAVAELTEAIDRNPSLALAHVILGSTFGYAGMPDDGLHHLAIATRLSPRDYTEAGNLATQGMCHLMARRFPEAVALEQRAVQLRPHFGAAWRTLAAAAGLAGDIETAAAALAQAKRLHPSLSVEWVEKYHPIVQEKDREMYIEGLVAAGLR
jgi:TolB-like protein/Flp pilus assembly protein TadD